MLKTRLEGGERWPGERGGERGRGRGRGREGEGVSERRRERAREREIGSTRYGGRREKC